MRRDLMFNKCRECFNREYGTKLRREDCYYQYYPSACAACGQVKNIVVDVRLLKRWKLLSAKPEEK